MCRSGLLILFCLGLLHTNTEAQTNRYFVAFNDKTGTPFSIDNPEAFLSEKSIARRQKQQIAITETDLPVNPDYVQQLKDLGVSTYYTSRWWNGVLVETSEPLLSTINTLSFVRDAWLVAPGQKLSNGRIRRIKQRNQTTSEPSAVNQVQLNQLGLNIMHQQGYKGETIAIAILDAGFQGVDVTAPFSLLHTEGRLKQTFNFVNNNSNVFTADDHGTEVLSVMGAYAEGSYIGGAYKADYYLYLTEDISSEYRIEEFNWMFAAEKADSAGVDIINSSLGYNVFDLEDMNYTTSQLDGNTAVITQAAKLAIERGILVVCSAGNEGNRSWKYVTPPADAQGILAIGSVTSGGSRSSFSSIGPTSDNRLKPDVAAMGTGTVVIRGSGSIGTTSGTSLASPLVASLAAGVWQAYPDFTVSRLYEVITRSASQANTPDNMLGYGIPHFQAIENFLAEPKPQATLSVFPNPVIGNTFQIQLNELVNPVIVTIFDSKGARVTESTLEINWQNNPFEYDVSAFQAGLYYVRIKSGHTQSTFRIMKQ